MSLVCWAGSARKLLWLTFRSNRAVPREGPWQGLVHVRKKTIRKTRNCAAENDWSQEGFADWQLWQVPTHANVAHSIACLRLNGYVDNRRLHQLLRNGEVCRYTKTNRRPEGRLW